LPVPLQLRPAALLCAIADHGSKAAVNLKPCFKLVKSFAFDRLQSHLQRSLKRCADKKSLTIFILRYKYE